MSIPEKVTDLKVTLDFLTGINIIEVMETKPLITPNQFAQIKDRYENALRLRALQMKAEAETMKQADIARRWHVHAAVVIRSAKHYQPE